MGSMSHIDIYTKAFKAFSLVGIQGDLQCSLLQESLVTYYCTCRYHGSLLPQLKYVIMCIGSNISKFQHLMKPYRVYFRNFCLYREWGIMQRKM
jgi:hypothetical protein